MEPALCPECGATVEHLEICIRTWHAMKAHVDGGRLVVDELGPVTDEDAGAVSDVCCTACGWSGTETDVVAGALARRQSRQT